MDVTWRSPLPVDYDVVISSLDAWWGGRSMTDMLPRLFFDQFRDTSLVAVDGDGEIAAFVVAFVSAAEPDLGYIHFVGVDPQHRGQGLGAQAYAQVFEVLRSRGCERVKAVTSPANLASQAFHRSLGFDLSDPIADYDGPGQDRVVLTRPLVGD